MTNAAVPLTHPDKALYPTGFTKRDVADFYRSIAPVLLVHLRDRPLTLKRYPNGVQAPFFYEKECPKRHPPGIRAVALWSAHRNAPLPYCTATDEEGLAWLANLANIELHTTLSRGCAPDCPTSVVFDLDPGAPADVIDCARVALQIRDLLAGVDLETLVKTSGSKGLQVYAPLNTPTTFADTKPFAHAVAALLAKRDPDRVVAHMSRALRHGKIFIDWSQNDPHKTTVSAYSLRALTWPSVSTPLAWREVEHAARLDRGDLLRFDSAAVQRRIARHGDLFADHARLHQTLPRGPA